MILFWDDPLATIQLIAYHYFWSLGPMVPALILAFWARMRLARVVSGAGRSAVELPIDGAGAASAILGQGGASGRSIVAASGPLANFYDPARRELRLSEAVFEGRTPQAIAIASHEAGHALQPDWRLKLRIVMVFGARLGTIAAWICVLGGVLMLNPELSNRGVALYLEIVLALLAFQVVEKDANRRIQAVHPLEGLDEAETEAYQQAIEAARWFEIASTLPLLPVRPSRGPNLFG